ncbi:hypothetical protein TVAG_436470 [Trichomonas vaginalis G3]|uniref:Initiator binding domain-containing protein n=1 Tax=Trichomonas vaginalis (strain ATCC PRA-98 / G3) TaxID=412133 RepID=A2DF95_TRIV3|nr:transcription-initiator DNA-binding domain ibd family [Trichomonas vaginalis G3]EAY20823.1 hypothetical protein TVAG_436470 [Trichomonas vaginalis G3]KAI5521569.1 transcription-initiator DNA-binding domain ibd family [Trichomonas vaginalis G3]|eukprot:XP_001581809.1 hypothetical protein [Trichomonas vaginalis G3]
MSDDFTFDDFDFDNQGQGSNQQEDQTDLFGTGETFAQDFSFDEVARNDYSSSFSCDSSSINQNYSPYFSEPFRNPRIQSQGMSAGLSPIDMSASQSNIRMLNSQQRLRSFNGLTSPNMVPLSKRPIHQTLPSKFCAAAMDTFIPRAKRSKRAEIWQSTDPISARTDDQFNSILQTNSHFINPSQCGFIPSLYWPNKDFLLGDIILDFFQRKSNINCRFIHKLYNALRIVQIYPMLKELIGIEWISPNILKVRKCCFARLLGIKSIDGGLFHKQGNFPSLGFRELTMDEANVYCQGLDISDVDYENVKLLVHAPGQITANWNEKLVFGMTNSVVPRA